MCTLHPRGIWYMIKYIERISLIYIPSRRSGLGIERNKLSMALTAQHDLTQGKSGKPAYPLRPSRGGVQPAPSNL